MYAGSVAVPLIVGRARKLTAEQAALLISADLFCCGLVKQAHGLYPPLESGILLTSIAELNLYFNDAKGDTEGAVQAAKVAEAHGSGRCRPEYGTQESPAGASTSPTGGRRGRWCGCAYNAANGPSATMRRPPRSVRRAVTYQARAAYRPVGSPYTAPAAAAQPVWCAMSGAIDSATASA